MSAAADVVAQLQAAFAAQLDEASATLAQLLEEGRQIETKIHALGMSCTELSAALSRTGGTA